MIVTLILIQLFDISIEGNPFKKGFPDKNYELLYEYKSYTAGVIIYERKNQSFFFLIVNAVAPASTRNAVGTATPLTPVFGLSAFEFEEPLFLLDADVVLLFDVAELFEVDAAVVFSSSFLISKEYGVV